MSSHRLGKVQATPDWSREDSLYNQIESAPEFIHISYANTKFITFYVQSKDNLVECNSLNKPKISPTSTRGRIDTYMLYSLSLLTIYDQIMFLSKCCISSLCAVEMHIVSLQHHFHFLQHPFPSSVVLCASR